MSELDLSYKDFQEIEYDEFYEKFWEAISEKVVSTQYLDLNRDFIENLTYDSYFIFKRDETISIRVVAKLAESFFFNYFKFQPGHKNIPELKD